RRMDRDHRSPDRAARRRTARRCATAGPCPWRRSITSRSVVVLVAAARVVAGPLHAALTRLIATTVCARLLHQGVERLVDLLERGFEVACIVRGARGLELVD